MRLVIIFSLLLIASLLQAMPSLQDTVTYEGHFTSASDHKVAGFTQELTVTNIDTASGKVTIHEDTYLPDASLKSEDKVVESNSVFSSLEMKDLLSHCQENHGTEETITVSGGQFATCVVDNNHGGKTWFGDVPFNKVKETVVDEEQNLISIEVVLFKFGKE